MTKLSEAEMKKLERYKSPHPVLGPKDEIGEGDCRIVYDVFPRFDDKAFADLKKEVLWQKMLHVGGEVPRLVCVQGDIAGDGTFPVYRHPSDQSPPLLHFSSKVREIKTEVEKIVGHPMNHVLIQLYRDGKDRIESHSDKTLDIVRGSSIVNVSFGAQRTMRLTTKTADAKRAAVTDEEKATAATKNKKTQLVPMPHGSVFVFGLKTNEAWLHGINPDKRREVERKDEERAYGGQRISFTFRNIATFLSNDEKLIWGQGARGKGRDQAEPVVNGDEERNKEMILAFGLENQSSKFDWQGVYGAGFNVLHTKNAPPSIPLLFLSDYEDQNNVVRVLLKEAGMVVHEVAAINSPRTCLRDNDKQKTQVYGFDAVKEYLAKR